MKRKQFLLGLVFSALLALVPIYGAEKSAYLASGLPDVMNLLPPPPVAGSAEQAADLASVKAIIGSRTQEDVTEARREDELGIFTFTPAIGDWFKAGQFPKTEAFFKQVEKDTRQATYGAKDFWKRPRPFVVDTTIVPLEMEKSPSYPSGHSTRGTVFAYVLAELFPAQREAILRQGRAAGWHRVTVGVHFPTDIYAGRVLGLAIFNEFKRSERFRAALEEARAELAALRPAAATAVQAEPALSR